MHELHELPGDVVLDIVALGDGSSCTSFPAMQLALDEPTAAMALDEPPAMQSLKGRLASSTSPRPPWLAVHVHGRS